jgi:hypothetical protein
MQRTGLTLSGNSHLIETQSPAAQRLFVGLSVVPRTDVLLLLLLQPPHTLPPFVTPERCTRTGSRPMLRLAVRGA